VENQLKEKWDKEVYQIINILSNFAIMAYLYFRDYKRLIQLDNLNQIIGNDTSLIEDNESVAVTEMKSYLVQKYNVNKEFTDTLLFVPNTAYNVNQRVYIDAPAYLTTVNYNDNDLCLYGGKVYICIDPTTGVFNPAKWFSLGNQYDMFYSYYSSGFFDYYKQYEVNQFTIYENKIYKALRQSTGIFPNKDATIWQFQGNYSTAGTDVTNTSVWKSGDNRNQQIVNYLVSIMLYHTHSRISPRNIPELRVKHYDDAIKWLKNCATGEDINAGIELLQPTQGLRTRFGGSVAKNINTY